MILVGGSTGRIGSRLVHALVIKGVPVRAMVHKTNLKMWEFWSEVETATADMAKPFSVAAAADGCEAAFLASSLDEEQTTLQGNFIEACKMAGVKYVVKLSAFGADPASPVNFLRWHGEIEARLAASGLQFTVLRPHVFMQNIFAYGPTVIADGTFVSPLAPDTALSMIDLRDVAAVAAGIFSGAPVPGAHLNVTGPTAVDANGLARQLSESLQKPVVYKQIARTAFEDALVATGVPAWHARGMGELYEWFDADPAAAATVTEAVETYTGASARTLDAFIKEFKDRFEPEPEEPEYQEYQEGTYSV